MRENLTSGSMWQGMETRRMPRRHSLTLPLDGGDSLPFSGILLASGFFLFSSNVQAHPAAGNAHRWAVQKRTYKNRHRERDRRNEKSKRNYQKNGKLP